MLVAKVMADNWHQQKAQEVASLRPFYGVRDRLAVMYDVATYTFDQSTCASSSPNLFARK